MKITCWNDKNEITLDAAAVAAAIKEMDTSKHEYYDVVCPKCGRTNNTKRKVFEAAQAEMSMRGVDRTKMVKEENAERRKKKGKE